MTAKTMEEVFREIQELKGLDGLSNGRMLISLFSDLSTDKKDLRLVRYLVESSCHRDLLEIEKLSPAMRQSRFQQTINKLCAEMLVSEDAARQVCTAFYNAVYCDSTQIQASEKAAVPNKGTVRAVESVRGEKTPIREDANPKTIIQKQPRSQVNSVSTEVDGRKGISKGIVVAIAIILIALCMIFLPQKTEKEASIQKHATKDETVAHVSIQEDIQPEELLGVLMSDKIKDEASDQPAFRTNLMRSQVASIRFESTLKNVPQGNATDVSANGDGSVLAWTKENGNLFDLYIAAEGGVKAPKNCNGLFALYKNAEIIDYNNSFDTSAVTDMGSMFLHCESVREITTEQMDTSNVINMGRMFDYCKSLTSLEVGGFNTAQVKNMSFMFNSCSSLTELDVSNFDTSNVERASYMFFECTGLQSLSLGSFNTSRMVKLSSMFGSCKSLTALDVSNFDTSNVEDMSYMFYRCSGLQTLDLRKFDTSNVTDMSSMFYKCQNLAYLDLSSFDVSKVAEYSNFMESGRTIGGQPWEKFFTS